MGCTNSGELFHTLRFTNSATTGYLENFKLKRDFVLSKIMK
jgi:hypothetical protein